MAVIMVAMVTHLIMIWVMVMIHSLVMVRATVTAADMAMVWVMGVMVAQYTVVPVQLVNEAGLLMQMVITRRLIVLYAQIYLVKIRLSMVGITARGNLLIQ